jgi:hypothetical protein
MNRTVRNSDNELETFDFGEIELDRWKWKRRGEESLAISARVLRQNTRKPLKLYRSVARIVRMPLVPIDENVRHLSL